MMRIKLLTCMLGLCSFAGIAQTPANSAAQDVDIVLHGDITPEKYFTHEMLAFTVPKGMERLNVQLDSPGMAKGMYLTAGIFDPERYRGEGRTAFTLSAVDATGPYLPGPIVAGVWHIAIGYNYIAPGSRGNFTVRIHLSPQIDPETYPVLNKAAGWYKGDMHSHTGRTDGACKSQSGANVPCPPSRLFAAAAAEGLDFLAVTDHNSQSTFNEILHDQLYYDKMLMIPSEEVTTVKGHANVWGTEGFLDYRVADKGFTVNDFFDQAHKLHALVSINHAYWPWDRGCPGCGWGWEPQTDFSKVDAIEIINGYHENGSWFKQPAGNGVPFWEAQLAKGLRPTGVGGGDDHRAGEQLPLNDGVGIPTTVVYAQELSQPAILEGVKAGHVYVMATGPNGTPLLLAAGEAMMGDEISAASGTSVTFKLTVGAGATGKLRLLVDGKDVDALPLAVAEGGNSVSTYAWKSDGKRHWVRAELDDAAGAPMTLTNPIYVNWGR